MNWKLKKYVDRYTREKEAPPFLDFANKSILCLRVYFNRSYLSTGNIWKNASGIKGFPESSVRSGRLRC